MQFHLVAGILHLRQAAQDETLLHPLAPVQVQHHFQVGLGVAQAVNGGDGGNDDGIGPFQQGLGGGQAHLFYMLVDGGVFFDIGIGGRHISFRLVIIVIGNEVFHGIVREELAHFAVQLCGQGLVRRQDQRRALNFLDQVGDGKGLAGTCYTEQSLLRDTAADAIV